MRKKTYIICLPVLIAILAFIPGEKGSFIQGLNKALQMYQLYTRQQKAYIHVDKSHYYPGEKIWFKAYVVNAGSLSTDTLSDHVYVDMVHPSGKVVQTRLLKLGDGVAWGDFQVQDTARTGEYFLQAYTNWMRNFNHDLIFGCRVFIENPEYGNFITRYEEKAIRRENRKITRNNEGYQIYAFHENNRSISGLESRLKVEVKNGFDQKLSTNLVLLNQEKETIQSFTTGSNGLAMISYTPVNGEKYFIQPVNDQLQIKRITLSSAKDFGVTLVSKSIDKDTIHLELNSNKPESIFSKKYYLIGTCRGEISYAEQFKLENQHGTIKISRDIFPPGAAHFALFDVNGNLEAERLVYLPYRNNDQVDIRFQQTGEHTFRFQIENKLIKQFPDQHTSVSVVAYREKQQYRSTTNIQDYLLLGSEIGESDLIVSNDINAYLIGKPTYRVDWYQIINKRYPEISYNAEKGITVKGKTTRIFFGIPLKNCDVSLTILDSYNDIYTTKSNEDGEFIFENLEYFDTVNAVIEAQKPGGSHNLVVEVSERPEIENNSTPGLNALRTIKRTGDKVYQYPERMHTDTIYDGRTALYNSPDNVIYMEDVPSGYTNMSQVLQGRVPGLNVTRHGDVNIRNSSSFHGSNSPLVLIDGIPAGDADVLNSISPIDVERVEILKGVNTTIYGARGANGVIAVYTKRGYNFKSGFLDLVILGYHIPIDFEQVVIDSALQTTIYWNPEITLSGGEIFETDFTYHGEFSRIEVVVEGMLESGHPIHEQLTFKREE